MVDAYIKANHCSLVVLVLAVRNFLFHGSQVAIISILTEDQYYASPP